MSMTMPMSVGMVMPVPVSRRGRPDRGGGAGRRPEAVSRAGRAGILHGGMVVPVMAGSGMVMPGMIGAGMIGAGGQVVGHGLFFSLRDRPATRPVGASRQGAAGS